jgi:hypothetical protein
LKADSGRLLDDRRSNRLARRGCSPYLEQVQEGACSDLPIPLRSRGAANSHPKGPGSVASRVKKHMRRCLNYLQCAGRLSISNWSKTLLGCVAIDMLATNEKIGMETLTIISVALQALITSYGLPN